MEGQRVWIRARERVKLIVGVEYERVFFSAQVFEM